VCMCIRKRIYSHIEMQTDVSCSTFETFQEGCKTLVYEERIMVRIKIGGSERLYTGERATQPKN